MCYSRMDYGMEEQLRRLREEEEREERLEAAAQQQAEKGRVAARELTRV